jgi:hypothetical protein
LNQEAERFVRENIDRLDQCLRNGERFELSSAEYDLLYANHFIDTYFEPPTVFGVELNIRN